MVIYKRDRGVELATTEKKASAVTFNEGIELGAYTTVPPRRLLEAILEQFGERRRWVPLFLDTKSSLEVLFSAQRVLQFSVVYTNYVSVTSKLSKSPKQISHASSKISFANGIDDWVTERADHETAVGDESCFGGNFNASGEISEQSANPRWKKAQEKRHDYDVDICSYTSFFLPPNHLLLTLLAFF